MLLKRSVEESGGKGATASRGKAKSARKRAAKSAKPRAAVHAGHASKRKKSA